MVLPNGSELENVVDTSAKSASEELEAMKAAVDEYKNHSRCRLLPDFGLVFDVLQKIVIFYSIYLWQHECKCVRLPVPRMSPLFAGRHAWR